MRVAAACALVVWLGAAACGRVGFDQLELASSDAGMADADVDADTTVSLCTDPRLVAHWPMDETTGSAIADVAGGNDGTWSDDNDGVIVGEAQTGHTGGALSFQSGDMVVVSAFVMPSEGTFSAWVTSDFDDSDLFGGAHPILIDAPPPRTTISYESNSGYYGLRTNDVSWQTTYTPPGDLTGWFHLTATWSATGSQLYLNGDPIGTPGTEDARSTSPAGLYIGTRSTTDRQWGGLIDEVRIYDFAMTPSQVEELFACP